MARKSSIPSRKAWEDRYRTPTVQGLLLALDKPQLDLVQWVRAALCGMDGVEEALSWQGIPWRWTLSYAAASGERPWAYLVPQPTRPLLALPLDPEVVAEVAERKYSKLIKDGVLLAPVVGGVRWTHWELTSKMQAEEVLALARRAQAVSVQPA
jgi:hypothetical protein